MPEKITEHIPQQESAPRHERPNEPHLEQQFERVSAESSGKKKRSKRTSAALSQTSDAAAAAVTLDPETVEIESVLAQGMENFFLGLSPQKQMEFKTKGEETARSIRQALRKKTTRIKDIVRLIIGWLKTLPGINRFFLEQEAKIKADRIMQRYTK